MPAGVYPPERWDAAAALLKAGRYDEFAALMKQYDAKFEASYDFGNWTPSFNNGTTLSAAYGWYIRFNRRLLIMGFRVTINAVGSIGPNNMVLPFVVGGISGGQPVGFCWLNDVSTPANSKPGIIVGDTIVGLGENATGNFQDLSRAVTILAEGGGVTTTVPFTWATGDEVAGTMIFPLAPSTGV